MPAGKPLSVPGVPLGNETSTAQPLLKELVPLLVTKISTLKQSWKCRALLKFPRTGVCLSVEETLKGKKKIC